MYKILTLLKYLIRQFFSIALRKLNGQGKPSGSQTPETKKFENDKCNIQGDSF